MPRCRVLLVDDIATVRQAVARYLEIDGRFEVVGEASDGVEAVEAASARECDAILLDQQMPRASGLDALPVLRRLHPHARIVMYSSDDTVRAQALARGADAYIDKVTPADVVAAALLGEDVAGSAGEA